MAHPYRNFERFYWLACLVVLFFVAWRAAMVPFAHDEAATFFYYIQSGRLLPFRAHADANNHFLLSAASWVSYKLFGSSPAALRLPSVLSFVLLCYAVLRVCKLFSSIPARIIFASAFVWSFNFTAFYSLCRGYGMSMAFLVLALYYYFIYRRYFATRHFVKCMLSLQLALAANLTLVPVLGLLGVTLLFMQWRRKALFSAVTIFTHVVSFALLAFWLRYAFYLKSSGALYYGEGESYWQVTFKSLIALAVMPGVAARLVCIAVFVVIVYVAIRSAWRNSLVIWSDLVVCTGLLLTLMIAFFTMKHVLHVNYPEDRTGLFFFVFFMLSLAFLVNEAADGIQLVFLYVPLFFVSYFIIYGNARTHPWAIYETFPQRFYDLLRAEQLRAGKRITIASHRVRELMYAFMNYNGGGELNPATAPEALQMNCDYAIAKSADRPWYGGLYEEIDSEPDWDFVLLRRIGPLGRVPLNLRNEPISYAGSDEYVNIIELRDTVLNSTLPLQCDLSLYAASVPVPLNAWVVMQVDGQATGEQSFVRWPLNWQRLNWRGIKANLSLVTGNVPSRIKRLVVYLWNIDHAPLNFTALNARLFRLTGEGTGKISNATL